MTDAQQAAVHGRQARAFICRELQGGSVIYIFSNCKNEEGRKSEKVTCGKPPLEKIKSSVCELEDGAGKRDFRITGAEGHSEFEIRRTLS